MTPALPSSFTLPEFEALIKDVRPALHRYIAHLIGSTIDAEDVVQDTFVKALDSLAMLNPQSNVRGWLFRVAHNKAADHLRRHANQELDLLDEYPMTDAPDQPLEDKELAALALTVFLKLAPRQRSCVIFKDVMGYSLVEISELLNATVPEIKAALHRGRTRLRELSTAVEGRPLPLDDHERELLTRYVDRFNARDFDALRLMLMADVQLDLVGQAKRTGAAEISNRYFSTYNVLPDWRLEVGRIEGRLVVLVYDSAKSSSRPAYFVLLTWLDKQVAAIRDFRFARYVMRDVQRDP